MNKIEKVLLDSVKNMKGNILGFGNIHEKIIESIDKNNNILEFTLLSDKSNTSKSLKDIFNRKSNRKNITFKKICKKFRKKNITNIIASYDDLGKYHRRFVMDSLYLAKENIYVFITDEDIDVDLIEKRFKRYKQDVKLIECKDGLILKIEKSQYKKNKLKDIVYLLCDWIVDVVNLIGDLYVS